MYFETLCVKFEGEEVEEEDTRFEILVFICVMSL